MYAHFFVLSNILYVFFSRVREGVGTRKCTATDKYFIFQSTTFLFNVSISFGLFYLFVFVVHFDDSCGHWKSFNFWLLQDLDFESGRLRGKLLKIRYVDPVVESFVNLEQDKFLEVIKLRKSLQHFNYWIYALNS